MSTVPNPTGRVDVLLMRGADLIGPQLAGHLWPDVRPAVQSLVERHVPRTLGTLWPWEGDFWGMLLPRLAHPFTAMEPFSDLDKAQIPPPNRPPGAPAAPNWAYSATPPSPAQSIQDVLQQAGNDFTAWARNPFPDLPADDDNSADYTYVLAIAAAALGLGLFVVVPRLLKR